MSIVNRRKHRRIALAADVHLGSADNFFAGRARDLSFGGLFVETDLGLAIDAPVTVCLVLEGQLFFLPCEVTWRLMGAGGRPAGVGLRFVSLDATARDAIERFMERREPLRFRAEAPAAGELVST